MLRQLLFVALAVAGLVAPSRFFAQENESGRLKVAPNLTGRDPFSVRANRVPKQKTDSRQTQTAQERDVKREVGTISKPTTRTKSVSSASDALFLLDSTEPVVCEIKSLSNGSGIVATVSGKEKIFATSEVGSVELAVTEEYQLGEEAFASGKKRGDGTEYRRALELFKSARKKAVRRIEKELATARIVDAYAALGQDDEAVGEFFLLCRLDPFTAYLESIPLRWINQTTLARGSSGDMKQLVETTAVEWLKPKQNPSGKLNPTGRLLAASILLNSSRHSQEAREAMQSLVVLEAPDGADEQMKQAYRTIALLASAQMERLAILRKPTESELARWRQTLELLPDALRIGPATLIAQAEKSLGQDENAARDFLKISTLAAEKFSIAEYSAKEAANAYERLQRSEVAQAIQADAQRRFNK